MTTTESTESVDSTRSVEVLDPRPDPAPQRRSLRTRWDGVPLRARLVAILVVLLALSLAVTGWGTQHVLRDFLVRQLDGQLTKAMSQTLRPAMAGPGTGNGQSYQPPSDYVVHVAYDDGRPAEQPGSSRDADDQPAFPDLTSTKAKALGNHTYTVTSPSGEEWRVLAAPASLRQGFFGPTNPGSVQIALSMSGVDDAVNRVRLLVLLFGVGVTGICVLFGWLAIRRSFAPLTEVEETAAAIAAGDLSRRIPEHPASTEVGRLTTSLNGMLAQIESAFRAREASEQRTRRFAADASHELRTPLASIRGFAELYRQGAVRDPDDVARTMSRIEDESRRMGALVEDLLLLARLDEQRPSREDPVDLAVLAGDATHDARGLAPDRDVKLVGLGGRGPEPAVVIGDENRLRQVVANLVGNAARHTPPGTPIEVAVGRTDGRADGRAVLEVRDHGPGLPPEHASRVFERFYRVDSSRTRGTGGGSGLGLSIVAAVVAAHGGRVGVTTTPGGGATFRVELPPAPPPPPDELDLED